MDDDFDAISTIAANQSTTIQFSIHVVASIERALDVLVFRHGTKLVQSVEDVMAMDSRATSIEMALQTLAGRYNLENYSANGDDDVDVTGKLGDWKKQLTRQFYAIVPAESPVYKNMQAGHGVIGSVDAATEVCSNINNKKKRSKDSDEDDDDIGDAPSIHLELKNLRVHECARRQGIGQALVGAVQQYARRIAIQEMSAVPTTTTTTSDEENMVVVYLQVDVTNAAAIRLYKQMGFAVDPQDSTRMTWSPR